MAVAACRDEDVEVFFPVQPDRGSARPAQHVCVPCPARTSCLGYAMRHGIEEGIFGGLTPSERRRERARVA